MSSNARTQIFGDAEVNDTDTAVGAYHDVRGFDVAMDTTTFMHIAHGVENLAHEVDGPRHRERTVAFDVLLDGDAFHIFHGEEEVPVIIRPRMPHDVHH